MGVGDAAKDSKLIDGAVRDLTLITGQKPQVTKAASRSPSSSCAKACHWCTRNPAWRPHVGIRGPSGHAGSARIRDFRGLSGKQFDGNGNYTFGLTEQVMFHEIDQDSIDRTRGMDITVVTTAKTDDEGRALLKALGFPFKTEA
jgi:large subunit ribosomal protein L5